MQATLDPPTRSIDTVVQERVPIQLVFIEAAIREQQKKRELGDDKNMMKMYRMAAEALDELGEQEHPRLTHAQLAELWEQAGEQLRGTRYYAEHNHCVISAINHYKDANQWDRAYGAFRKLYGK